MKILCNKKTDESLHVFSDSTDVYLSNGSLWFKYKELPDFEVKGFDDENFIIYENVEVSNDWLSRSFKYNPSYGWKINDIFEYKTETYEDYLDSFLFICSFLKKKKLITNNQYKKLIDFSEIENLLYHPISHYMRK